MNQMTTYHWSFDEDVINYRAAGLQGIGVWRRKLTDFGEERGIDLLRDSGLRVTSLSYAGGFTGSDGQTFREALDDALDALRLAAEMQAGCLTVVTGGRAGHTLNHARRLAREALRELGDAGAALDVQIAVQPLHAYAGDDWTFLTSITAAIDLLRRCDHPQVGLVCDAFPTLGAATPALDAAEIARWTKIAVLRNVLSPVLMNDGELAALATVRDNVDALESGLFGGWYEVQVLCEKLWKSDYQRLLTNCRKNLAPELSAAFGAGQALRRPTLDSAAAGNERSIPDNPLPAGVEPSPPG